MTGESIFEVIAGLVAVYVGIRCAIAREIPIVHEGRDEPIGWLRGYETVIAGGLVASFGLYMLAVAFSFAHLPGRG